MPNDTLSDLLCRIKNALLIRHTTVNVLNTSVTKKVCTILEKEGLIRSYKVLSDKEIVITLKYGHRRPAIQHCHRISKPSLRIYTKHKNLKTVLNGMGTIVLSTSLGIMTERDARAKHVGGEVLFAIW
jgi:small subunit ribosomal protein S8